MSNTLSLEAIAMGSLLDSYDVGTPEPVLVLVGAIAREETQYKTIQ